MTKFPKIVKLGLIDGNLVIIATKFSFLWPSFSTIFWKYMIQTSYQKFVQSKLVLHSNSFLCKRMCLYLQKSSDSKMFCDQKKLGGYHDQVSVFWKNGHDNDQVIFNLVVIFWDRSTTSEYEYMLMCGKRFLLFFGLEEVNPVFKKRR